jgi:peptide/nickel transport system substrate-binding protein/oligopeptide transport system substrate-binding protein
MAQHARTVLLVSLWVSCVLLVHSLGSRAATSESPEPGTKFGGTYRRMLANNPPTLDPSLTVDVYSRAVVTQLFDGLVQFDTHLKPIPAIAEFWEASQDRRTWTFSLRRGVTFHHGREVTADDFVYSFTRLLKAAKPGPLTDLLRRIQGAGDFLRGQADRVQGLRAVDRYTLVIMLEEPFASLLAALGLANAAVVPREVVEQQGEQFARAPVGTGPFTFVRWEPDKEIVLQANDQYYEGRPFLDTVVFKIGGTFEENFADFLKGNLEEALIPSEKTDEVHTDPQYQKFQIVRRPTLSLLYVGFNTRHKPFDDKRVRQAFNYAMNKEAIVRDITKMESRPATGALPPGMPGHDPDLRGYDYNPTKAKQLLAEAGYPNGAGLPVVQLWTISKAESTKAELVAYQRYLAEIGVQMEIRFEHDWPTYRKMLEQGQCPMFRLSWSARIPDPDDSLWHLLHSKNHRVTNHMFYHNRRVDALLEQARQVLNLTQRIALYREVEQLVMADAPWITQHYHVFQHLYQPYIKGMEVSLLGDWAVPMKKIWFESHRPEDSPRTTPDVQLRQ